MSVSMSGCPKDRGLSPWLPFIPENCNVLAGHHLWCGEGRFPQWDLRDKTLLSYIEFCPRARYLTDSLSSLSFSALGLCCATAFTPFCECLSALNSTTFGSNVSCLSMQSVYLLDTWSHGQLPCASGNFHFHV